MVKYGTKSYLFCLVFFHDCLRQVTIQHSDFRFQFVHRLRHKLLVVLAAQHQQALLPLCEAQCVGVTAVFLVLNPLPHLVGVVLAGAVDAVGDVGQLAQVDQAI